MGQDRTSGLPWFGAYAALAAGWALLLPGGDGAAIFAAFLASRGAYVVFTALALRAQDEREWWTRRWGPEGGYRLFKRSCSVLMNNDAVACILVCWSSRGTLSCSLPPALRIGLGVAVALLGIGVKAWAVRTLGKGSYFWRSFFIPPEASKWVASGPYRWFENPMYTIGYFPAYGLAVVLDSVPGLIAALVAQTLMLLLNVWAEKPHTERMRLRTAGAGGG
jgi:isoprenylcysteine carboxyl methyltransferase (ICMT) family protein YpbQ